MNRLVSVSLLPDLMDPDEDLSDCAAVVIDVLRATSVMATAGAGGIRQIHTCRTTDETFAMARRFSQRPLLCGERQCQPIEGFDLGNSPAEYDPGTVEGRDMILTTTNGTRAIQKVLNARMLLVSSFLNLGATARTIANENHVHLVCSGTDGEVTLEDVLLAGALVESIGGAASFELQNDGAHIALATWKSLAQQKLPLGDAMRQSRGGKNLIAAGYEADIDRCGKVDAIDGIVCRSKVGESTFEYHPSRQSGGSQSH